MKLIHIWFIFNILSFVHIALSTATNKSLALSGNQKSILSYLSLLNSLIGKHFPTRRPIVSSTDDTVDPNEDPAVRRFRQYLRTNTAHPNPNYDSAVSWIQDQARDIGVEFKEVRFPPLNAAGSSERTVLLKYPGSDPSLSSVWFNSHMDTVAANPAQWTYDPFSAVKDSEGRIFARGAQDRKSQGAQYLEAFRRLKSQGFLPRRNIFVTFTPDEEVGGGLGMVGFLQTPEFQSMNVGVAIDEGATTSNDEFAIFYGERSVWQFRVVATGQSSHTALMLENNAGEKLNRVISSLMDYRSDQIALLNANPDLGAGDVTSINLSILEGGMSVNAVPSEFSAVFDMRIRVEPNFLISDAMEVVMGFVEDAGDGVFLNTIALRENIFESSIEPDDFWFTAISQTFNEMGTTFRPKIFPGATDARFVREAGFPAYGFSPLPNTEPLGHQDNEFIFENTFIEGISVFEKLFKRLSMVV